MGHAGGDEAGLAPSGSCEGCLPSMPECGRALTKPWVSKEMGKQKVCLVRGIC